MKLFKKFKTLIINLNDNSFHLIDEYDVWDDIIPDSEIIGKNISNITFDSSDEDQYLQFKSENGCVVRITYDSIAGDFTFNNIDDSPNKFAHDEWNRCNVNDETTNRIILNGIYLHTPYINKNEFIPWDEYENEFNKEKSDFVRIYHMIRTISADPSNEDVYAKYKRDEFENEVFSYRFLTDASINTKQYEEVEITVSHRHINVFVRNVGQIDISHFVYNWTINFDENGKIVGIVNLPAFSGNLKPKYPAQRFFKFILSLYKEENTNE